MPDALQDDLRVRVPNPHVVDHVVDTGLRVRCGDCEPSRPIDVVAFGESGYPHVTDESGCIRPRAHRLEGRQLLACGEIDGALVPGGEADGKAWRWRPVLARSAEEIVAARKSKHLIVVYPGPPDGTPRRLPELEEMKDQFNSLKLLHSPPRRTMCIDFPAEYAGLPRRVRPRRR